MTSADSLEQQAVHRQREGDICRQLRTAGCTQSETDREMEIGREKAAEKKDCSLKKKKNVRIEKWITSVEKKMWAHHVVLILSTRSHQSKIQIDK